MFFPVWSAVEQRGLALLQQVQDRITTWSKPAGETVLIGVVSDLARSKAELVLENALLRQQLTVLSRQVNRPHFTRPDRWLLATWRHALLILQPDTLLRWHRELFKHFWTHK
ncbi:MAG TPA: hypothetical protein VKQ72_10440, partial [Aggregatilineales bacterium]|nr:hypothetical protein [Aggregatilineales bacterium]